MSHLKFLFLIMCLTSAACEVSPESGNSVGELGSESMSEGPDFDPSSSNDGGCKSAVASGDNGCPPPTKELKLLRCGAPSPCPPLVHCNPREMGCDEELEPEAAKCWIEAIEKGSPGVIYFDERMDLGERNFGYLQILGDGVGELVFTQWSSDSSCTNGRHGGRFKSVEELRKCLSDDSERTYFCLRDVFSSCIDIGDLTCDEK